MVINYWLCQVLQLEHKCMLIIQLTCNITFRAFLSLTSPLWLCGRILPACLYMFPSVSDIQDLIYGLLAFLICICSAGMITNFCFMGNIVLQVGSWNLEGYITQFYLFSPHINFQILILNTVPCTKPLIGIQMVEHVDLYTPLH